MMAKKKVNKPKRGLRAKRENRIAYIFMLPWIIGFLLLTVFPFFFTIYLSMNMVGLSAMHGWEFIPVGFDNFAAAFMRNPDFTPALLEFFVMLTTYVPVIVIIAFLLALGLNSGVKGRSVFRSVFFLPAIALSGPTMHRLMDTGTTQVFTLQGIFTYDIIALYSPFIASGFSYLFQNFVLVLWFTGIPIVLFINGLQKISDQILEAAQIDGATSWQILWKIIIPIMKPIVLTVTIFSIVQLGVFAVNPVYDLILDMMANTLDGMGHAATFSLVYSVIILIFIGISLFIFRQRKEAL
jgi:ABC-type sugar transport system permease subunit